MSGHKYVMVDFVENNGKNDFLFLNRVNYNYKNIQTFLSENSSTKIDLHMRTYAQSLQQMSMCLKSNFTIFLMNVKYKELLEKRREIDSNE